MLVLITCCCVAVLVAQQGQTIDRQRSLIQLLWGDSQKLNTLKIQELQNQHSHPKAAPEEAPTPAPPAAAAPKKPAPKQHVRRPHPPNPEQRQAIERPGPRLLRYI